MIRRCFQSIFSGIIYISTTNNQMRQLSSSTTIYCSFCNLLKYLQVLYAKHKTSTSTVLSVDLVIWSTNVKQDISLLITYTVMILILGQIVWANNAVPD